MSEGTRSEEKYFPGDIVKTSFGVGVITHCPREDGEISSFRVLLWRIPGKSLASSSVAFLQSNAILGRLPVAPGMITTKIDTNGNATQYMVHCYYSSKNKYGIAPLHDQSGNKDHNNTTIVDKDDDGDDDEFEDAQETEAEIVSATKRLSRLSLTGQMLGSSTSNFLNGRNDVGFSKPTITITLVEPSDLKPATSAKFYPLLHELMKRGDQTAAATTEFFRKEEVSNVIHKATNFTQQQSRQALESTEILNADKAADTFATKFKGVVNEKEVKELLSLMKNEDLTVLLEKGKERLEQLMQQDIPKATAEVLEGTGIRIAANDASAGSPYMDAIIKSRKIALNAMDNLLKQAEVDPNDVQAIEGIIGDNFSTMYDSLTQAAKSDRALAAILETMDEQTAEWQAATGRLMSTRSASLFMEGASRIQARAATLFSKEQLNWAGEIGSRFTKAFTEGDAAVARLKSIELGDRVRNRLVQAIEVRSESLGGLDGIIAGALTTMQTNRSGDQMKDMLTSLQSQANSVSKDAHETLISVLARRSEYRDVSLLKLEQVLCDLESQFGDDFSAEDIAALARGEGGTAKLFEPIAKRAAKEIEKQLDAAESAASDPTMVDVLKHVRKIVSGELTPQAVLDEVVNILNDDKVVAVGENLVKQGEQVLDAIEGVSGNKVVDDVMQMAERAGITKDSLMEGIETLDVNELLDTAGNAVTDERARKKLLSDATDTALDFILRILPSMPVPPVDGVKDGLVYHISNLSLEGFRVKKENIIVEIAGMTATKKHTGPQIKVLESMGSNESNDDFSDAQSKSAPRSRTSSTDTLGMDFETSVDENVVVKATELLIIDVREVSAIFNDAVWGFEQTYLPYLKGTGKFDVKMSDGAIRLVFELRKRQKQALEESKEEAKWEPVLCLHDRSCSIGAVEFNMQGGTRLAWVINKVASVFKGLLRDYVVKTILRILTDKSGWILAQLNQALSPFWDVLLRTAKLELVSGIYASCAFSIFVHSLAHRTSKNDLEEAGHQDIVAATPVERCNTVELVWREHIPLGMNLLLNDESGQLKVVDFPRGSQARNVCEKRNLSPEGFKGATIVAVNGMRYQSDEDLFEALRDPGRPKSIQFELAESEEAERIRKFVEDSQSTNTSRQAKNSSQPRIFEIRNVKFIDDRELGIEFTNSPDNFGLVIRDFLESDDGVVLAAERDNNVHKGDMLTHINGKAVLGADGQGRIMALKLLKAEGTKRPLTLSFSDPYLFREIYEKSQTLPVDIGGPSEFDLEKHDESKRIVVKGFSYVDGIAEKSGVLLGDYLVFVNGVAVGAGCRWLGESSVPSLQDVENMLKNEKSYPIGLTFARPQSGKSDRSWYGSGTSKTEEISMNSSETLCVTADCYEQLGIVFETKGYADIVVKDLEAVSGPFQATSRKFRDPRTDDFHLSIESVNGEFVPTFATPQMVMSAMIRSWKSENRVEILFCDDERKRWVQSLSRES